MNVRYRGKSELTGNIRLAEIQYDKDESEANNRLIAVLEAYGYKCFCEEEVTTIQVEDREDYQYIKSTYMKFKAFFRDSVKKHEALIQRLKKGIMSVGELYDSVDTDLDFYVILVICGYNEYRIKQIMRDVSYADDAYNNALDMLSAEII